jgi:glucokinase
LVAIDVGGTHARFALASVGGDGTISLGEPVTLKTSDHVSLQTAWEEFERRVAAPVPRAAAIAIAGPVTGEVVRMTNNSWVLHTGALDDSSGSTRSPCSTISARWPMPWPARPRTSWCTSPGPRLALPERRHGQRDRAGTGLGVAHFHRYPGGYLVQATEGGHIEFAPLDALDDWMLARLRKRHLRVSTERVHSGPGICEIYAAIAALEKARAEPLDDRTIWQRGIAREDSLCAAAVDRFCHSLGSLVGDYALAHGASAVVLAGGLGLRLRDVLPQSGFGERFRFKGRYTQMMSGIPVKLITHPQPGLFGAAAAFATEHLS